MLNGSLTFQLLKPNFINQRKPQNFNLLHWNFFVICLSINIKLELKGIKRPFIVFRNKQAFTFLSINLKFFDYDLTQIFQSLNRASQIVVWSKQTNLNFTFTIINMKSNTGFYAAYSGMDYLPSSEWSTSTRTYAACKGVSKPHRRCTTGTTSRLSMTWQRRLFHSSLSRWQRLRCQTWSLGGKIMRGQTRAESWKRSLLSRSRWRRRSLTESEPENKWFNVLFVAKPLKQLPT